MTLSPTATGLRDEFVDFFSLVNGNLNFIILITSEHVDLLHISPSLLQSVGDDNWPANSSLLHKLPEVTPLKARTGNWKINLFF